MVLDRISCLCLSFYEMYDLLSKLVKTYCQIELYQCRELITFPIESDFHNFLN